MLRFILVVIFLLLYFLLGIPILGILWLIGRVNKRSADLAALRIVQWGFKVILKISGVEVTVIGEDRVPDEPVLYVGNHRSYFDILLTYSRCRNLTGFVAKKEMLNYPFLRTWMKRVYCLFLDRDNIREGLKHPDCDRAGEKWNFCFYFPRRDTQQRRRIKSSSIPCRFL